MDIYEGFAYITLKGREYEVAMGTGYWKAKLATRQNLGIYRLHWRVLARPQASSRRVHGELQRRRLAVSRQYHVVCEGACSSRRL